MTADTPLPPEVRADLSNMAANPVAGNPDVEAIRARHERDNSKTWLLGEPMNEWFEDRATLLRLVDSLSAEMAEKDKAVNDAVIATIDSAAHLLRTRADKAISRVWDEHLRWAATQVETLKSAVEATAAETE